jgi:hypothetical protein
MAELTWFPLNPELGLKGMEVMRSKENKVELKFLPPNWEGTSFDF